MERICTKIAKKGRLERDNRSIEKCCSTQLSQGIHCDLIGGRRCVNKKISVSLIVEGYTYINVDVL